MTPFARGFDRNVETQTQNPRRGGCGVVCGRQANARIRALAGGDPGRSSAAPFSPRHIQIGVIIKRRQCQAFEIPSLARPLGGLMIGFKELPQPFVIQGPSVKCLGSSRSGNWFGMVMDAAGMFSTQIEDLPARWHQQIISAAQTEEVLLWSDTAQLFFFYPRGNSGRISMEPSKRVSAEGDAAVAQCFEHA